MRNKKSMQKQLTILVGLILLISNLILMNLLNRATSMGLRDLIIPFGDVEIEVFGVDDLNSKLRLYGYIFAFLTTVSGTVITYIFLGKYLSPLKKLSKHMDNMERQNLSELADFSSNTIEVSSLIDSFNSMMAKLKKAFEMQRDFSAYAAHELKTPLAILQTRIDVFKKKDYGEKEAQKLLETISVQVGKLNDTVGKILELSNVERIELREDVLLNILLEDLLEDFVQIAFKENVELEFADIRENTKKGLNKSDFKITGNYTLLYQAFFNLLDNAIKYNYPGGKVRVEVVDDKKFICVKIYDTGRGIKEEDKGRVFEPFFRGEDLEKLRKEGSGMGLSFSKKVFDHHRARIELSDNNPKGSLIKVFFSK